MIFGHSLQVAQATLPLGKRVNTDLVKLMHELISVLLSKLIVELALELGVQLLVVFLALGPLAARTECLDAREQERSSRVKFSCVLVITQVHLEVQLHLVWLAKAIGTLVNQMLELGTVTGIVEVEHGRG